MGKEMKSRYIPNFPEMMRLTELNYARLSRLLPEEKRAGQQVSYQIGEVKYQIVLEETTRYTSKVKIQQCTPVSAFLALPSLSVRLYHDARVAEVCATQQIYRFKARYDYPNKKLHQRDEKHQINRFLAEWLSYCLGLGIGTAALN
jgi:uncharacterized protein